MCWISVLLNVMYNSLKNTTFLVTLLPYKPKQKCKFKTKNQPLLQSLQRIRSRWRRKVGESRHNVDLLLRTRSVKSSFSINWVRPLQDVKAWRWHSKSRSAGISSDSDTVGLSVWSVSNGVAKGSSKLPALLTIHVSMLIRIQPTNHRNYTAIFSRRTESQFMFALPCHVRLAQYCCMVCADF